MMGAGARVQDVLFEAISKQGKSNQAYLKEPDEQLVEVITNALSRRFSMVSTDGLAEGKAAFRVVGKD